MNNDMNKSVCGTMSQLKARCLHVGKHLNLHSLTQLGRHGEITNIRNHRLQFLKHISYMRFFLYLVLRSILRKPCPMAKLQLSVILLCR